jgi:high-affinity iron transporter
VEQALDAAVTVLTATASPRALFVQSLIILVREGMEAILIIGALVAFLVRAGAPERKRDIGLGVLAAVVASLLTAAAFATLFRAAPAQQEVLEGVTMLAAAAVLFWVSYWLVSKVEARRWQQFVGGQMKRALGSGRAWALAAVAFLAVYREGFETVLFYAALFTTSDGTAAATGGIVAGIVVGVVILAAVYLGIERYGVRIPLKQFFVVTSALLYLMAFSFAGKGVAELQEAGVISITPLDWLPSLPALGIFPTYQTFVTQLFVAAALAGAIVWVFLVEPVRARASVSP